jgi:hypothetical protein
MDGTFGILCLSISLELLFHVESSTTPNNIWNTLKGLSRNKYEMHGHILENELISLNSSNYKNLQDFFTRFNAFLLKLKGCRIDKSTQIDNIIISIISKLGLKYSVFISTFHTIQSIGSRVLRWMHLLNPVYMNNTIS